MRRPKWTTTGRVVYDRKIHVFSWKDLARVSRAIPEPTTVEDALAILSVAATIYLRALEAFYSLIFSKNLALKFWSAVSQLITQILDRVLLVYELPEDVRLRATKIRNLL